MYSTIIFGTAGWFLLFFLLQKLNTRCSSEWNSRIFAMFHGFVACRLVEYYIDWPLDFSQFGTTNLEWHNTLLIFSGSYFVFDTIYCLYTNSEGMVMIIHHIISLMCVNYALISNTSGYETSIALWVTELTNPLLQIRWFLRSMGWHTYKVAMLNELLFSVLFLVNRLFLASYFVFYLVFVYDTPIVVRIGCSILQVVNLVFSYQLVLMIRRRLKAKNTASHDE